MSNLSIEMLKQAIDQLYDEGYIVFVQNLASTVKYTLSEKGMQLLQQGRAFDLASIDQQIAVIEKPKNNSLKVIELQQNWMLGFMNFIIEAKVPKYCDNGKGDQYIVNNYSEPAMKVFKKAIEKENIIYDVLVKSTMLYYKSTKNRFKKAIANYFVQGDWRSDYAALLEAAGTGTIENHIKSEMDNGTKSKWKLG